MQVHMDLHSISVDIKSKLAADGHLHSLVAYSWLRSPAQKLIYDGVHREKRTREHLLIGILKKGDYT